MNNEIILTSSMMLHRWLDQAVPGETVLYHKGHLAYDRERIFGNQRLVFACNNLCLTAYSEYEKGHVELTQKLVKSDKGRYFLYYITKRKFRRHDA